MVGEEDAICDAGSGGGEGDDAAVLRSLEKVLAKQHHRRPSKEVRYAHMAAGDSHVHAGLKRSSVR